MSFSKFVLATTVAGLCLSASCSNETVIDPESRSSPGPFRTPPSTTWEVYDQADFREAVLNYAAGDTMLLKKSSSELTFYMVNESTGNSDLSDLTLIGKSPRSTINMTDSVTVGALGATNILVKNSTVKNVFFEFGTSPHLHIFWMNGTSEAELNNCGWTFDGGVGPWFSVAGSDGKFDSTDDIPNWAPYSGGLYIEQATATITNCGFEGASDECDFPVDLGTDGVLEVIDWLHSTEKYSFENHGPVSNQNISVANDTAYVEFSVGASDDNEDILVVVARYKDDTDCGAGASEATANKNSTTGKWNAKFYVGGFTDGDFYWQGKASLCDSVEVGTCSYKHFRPGSGGSPPPWFED